MLPARQETVGTTRCTGWSHSQRAVSSSRMQLLQLTTSMTATTTKWTRVAWMNDFSKATVYIRSWSTNYTFVASPALREMFHCQRLLMNLVAADASARRGLLRAGLQYTYTHPSGISVEHIECDQLAESTYRANDGSIRVSLSPTATRRYQQYRRLVAI